jgi:tetratricopeptide (TPR) repeat protein
MTAIKGRPEEALAALRQAAALQPADFTSHFSLGVTLQQCGRAQEATTFLERALIIKPGNVETLKALGLALTDSGHFPAAERVLLQALARAPGDIDLLLNLALLAQTQSRTGVALDFYRKALEINSTLGRVRLGLAQLKAWTQADEETGLLLQTPPATDFYGDEDTILCAYARGKVLNDLSRYDEAFAAFTFANDRQQSIHPYDPRAQQAFFERHKRAQTPANLKGLATSAHTDNSAIFVLGMPRSGTSLVEQMLASHPQIAGAGEVEYTRLVVEACTNETGRAFPLGIEAVRPQTMADAAAAYLDRLRAHTTGGERRIVDKLPHNFLRIGLLATLLPGAHFIVCERDPLDVCLSIYQQHFSHSHPYASSLEALGHYYRLYEDLIAHWQQQYPGRLYRIRYESLVQDTNRELEQLLEHLGLPFDAACMAFDRNQRLVTTPSAAQVRMPVYTGSIGRWRHYAAHLGPLREALAD